jgi:hypothetical protein
VDGERGDPGGAAGAAESQLAAAAIDAAGARAKRAARQMRLRRADSALEGRKSVRKRTRWTVCSRAGCGVLSLRTTMDSTIRSHVDRRVLLRGLTVSFGRRSDRGPEMRRWHFLMPGLATLTRWRPPLRATPSPSTFFTTTIS